MCSDDIFDNGSCGLDGIDLRWVRLLEIADDRWKLYLTIWCFIEAYYNLTEVLRLRTLECRQP